MGRIWVEKSVPAAHLYLKIRDDVHGSAGRPRDKVKLVPEPTENDGHVET